MKLPKRFALSTLLLAMLLVSLVFGYAQWRRQWLLSEVNQLQASGAESLQLTGNWFWPSVPERVVVRFREGNDETFIIAGKALNHDDSRAHYDLLRRWLWSIGVEQVSCEMEQVGRNYEAIVFPFGFRE